MARSSRSMTTAGPISACSRSGSASARRGGLVYQAFDLLYLDGRSLLGVPLEDRKRLLQSVLRPHPRVRYSGHIEGEGKAFFEAAKAQRLEGVVAKLRRSRLRAGVRTLAWLKVKIRPEQELVVGGWTPGEGNARDLGAVVVGVYDDDGRLRFSGKVGSGFNGATRKAARSPRAAWCRGCAVRPAAAPRLQGPLGRRPQWRHLGPARARHPGRARWLVARRHGPPDLVQGHRGRPGPNIGRPRNPVETAAAVEEAESDALDGLDADDAAAGDDRRNGSQVGATKSRTGVGAKAAAASSNGDTVFHRARQCDPDRARTSPRRDHLGDTVRHGFRNSRCRCRLVARWVCRPIDKVDDGTFDTGRADVDADAPLPHCRTQ